MVSESSQRTTSYSSANWRMSSLYWVGFHWAKCWPHFLKMTRSGAISWGTTRVAKMLRPHEGGTNTPACISGVDLRKLLMALMVMAV